MHAQLCPALCDPWTVAWQAPLSVGFPGKNTGVGREEKVIADCQGIMRTMSLISGVPPPRKRKALGIFLASRWMSATNRSLWSMSKADASLAYTELWNNFTNIELKLWDSTSVLIYSIRVFWTPTISSAVPRIENIVVCLSECFEWKKNRRYYSNSLNNKQTYLTNKEILRKLVPRWVNLGGHQHN